MAFIQKNDSSENNWFPIDDCNLKNDSFLSLNFTKADLEKLCKVSRCPFKRNLTKKLISEKLHGIITSSGMLMTTVFGDTESKAEDDESLAGPCGFVESTVAEPSTSKPTKRTSKRKSF